MKRTIEISHRTIFFTLAVLIGLWVFVQIRDILYLLFISFIITTLIRPFVEILAVKLKVPRVLSILLIYAVLIGVIGTAVASMVPTLVHESTRLIQDLPEVIRRVAPSFNFNLQALTQDLAPITQNVLKVGFEIFNNIILLVSILVFTFYLLLTREKLRGLLPQYVGTELSERIIPILTDVEHKLGAWARGQLLLMIIIGFVSYIGLTLLRVEYALPLAIFAGLLEVVPMIGPIVGAIPAVLFSFTVSPLLALSVAALYFLIQQFENHLIVPLIMRQSVGLSPLLTIIALMVGGRFEGVIGAILAVPIVLVIQVISGHYFALREKPTISS